MYCEKNTSQANTLPAFVQDFLTKDMLLFDIETTGLSAARDQIYLIGCGYLDGSEVCVELFFAESPEDEKDLLDAFSRLARIHPILVTFNGAAFDLPFVKKRGELYALSDDTVSFAADFSHIDLYRETRRLDPLLTLPSYKQKAIEQFLGCDREDELTGKELIEIYRDYVSRPDPDLLRLLLLHNREDVIGMFDLLWILSYTQFTEGRFLITDITEESKGDRSFLNIKIQPEFPLPQSIHRLTPEAALILDRESALIRFPVFHGELKHFFEDPNDYYYLPEEDTAVHRSVGEFVDPSHRQKATKKNCYIKTDCDYLTIPVKQKSQYLQKEFQDKNTYLELPADPAGLRAFVSLYLSTFRQS